MKIIDSPSPNFGPRKDGKKVRFLVLHYTDTMTTEDALAILQDSSKEVSAHYVIGDDGRILQLVNERMRSWHAGKSCWEGETDINSTSIGIEIQNPGHSFGYHRFPEKQIAAVMELCRDIVMRHGILPHHVLGHSDIAPGRKQDPGHLFPWERLAQNGIGVWPNVEPAAKAPALDVADIAPLLHYYGYDPSADQKETLIAFQRHFEPQVFTAQNLVGRADLNTVQKIKSLILQKKAAAT